jgi:hypothetical protein
LRWRLAAACFAAAAFLASPATASGSSRAADPCAGARRCVEGQPADVTGDRAADRIGYLVKNVGTLGDSGRSSRVTVIVTTPRGDRMTRTVVGRGRLVGTYGAVPLDGVAGAEVVLLTRRGGGAADATVLTVRDGSLVLEPGPWQLLATMERGFGLTQKTPPFGAKATLQTCSFQVLPTGRVALTTKALDWVAGRWFGGGDTFTTSVESRREVPRGCGHWAVPGMTLQPLGARASR